MHALPDVRDQHPFDPRADPGGDEVHQLSQHQRRRPNAKQHRERHRARQSSKQPVFTCHQRATEIPYPAEVSAQSRVGDDLHHGSEGRGGDIWQRGRDHPEHEQRHDEAAHRPKHAQAAHYQGSGRRLLRLGIGHVGHPVRRAHPIMMRSDGTQRCRSRLAERDRLVASRRRPWTNPCRRVCPSGPARTG